MRWLRWKRREVWGIEEGKVKINVTGGLGQKRRISYIEELK